MSLTRARLLFLIGLLPSSLALASALKIIGPHHFEQLISTTISIFQPYATARGAKLTYLVHWDSSGAGACALRKDGGKTSEIWLY